MPSVCSLAGLMLLSSLSGCTSPPQRITCDLLRQVRPGMTPAEVEKLLGSPVSSHVQDMRLNPPSVQFDTSWHYTPWEWLSATSVTLTVRFNQNRLVSADSYYRSPLQDAPEMVFRLDATEMREGPSFREVYCAN
jgi:outer membrane protein assembly factor BamE (lipoprotein component of BamABCDE complex)